MLPGDYRVTDDVLLAATMYPRKYWLITQEAMAPSRYDWKIVDWDVKLNTTNRNYVVWPIFFLTNVFMLLKDLISGFCSNRLNYILHDY